MQIKTKKKKKTETNFIHTINTRTIATTTATAYCNTPIPKIQCIDISFRYFINQYRCNRTKVGNNSKNLLKKCILYAKINNKNKKQRQQQNSKKKTAIALELWISLKAKLMKANKI